MMDTNAQSVTASENELFKTLAEQEVPEVIEEPPVDAEVVVTVSYDKMSATIKMIPPKNDGAPITEQLINEALEQASVTAGINEGHIKRFAEKPVYNINFQIAVGHPPLRGRDGEVVLHFDTNPGVPKERGDGTVNFKEMGFVTNVNKGGLLCEILPGKKGEDGFDVYGTVLPGIFGKTPPVPNGKNTVLSEDGLKLMAACDGQIQYNGRVVNVEDVLTIRGDVGSKTGNIDFVGSVLITGDVKEGFIVRADGDVTVRGMVEGANVISGNNITITYGMNGMGKGRLEATGDVRSLFLESAIVDAKGDIFAESIMNSRITTEGSVTLAGRRAVLIGGECRLKKQLTAKVIGSSSNMYTYIEMITMVSNARRVAELKKDIVNAENEIRNINRAIRKLEEAKASQGGALTKEQIASLKSIVADNNKNTQIIQESKVELEEISLKEAEVDECRIYVKEQIYPNVKININNAIALLNEPRVFCTVYNDKGELVFGAGARS